MRRFGLLTITAACAALGASQAAAQGNVGFTVGDIYATHEVLQKRAQATSMSAPDSPFSQLSKDSRKWIIAEVKRQAETPRSPSDVAMDVDKTLEKDVAELSRRHRINPHDITLSVLLLIMADAEYDTAKAAKKARKAGDPAAAQAAAEKLEQATANRKEAFAMQSDVSLALAMM